MSICLEFSSADLEVLKQGATTDGGPLELLRLHLMAERLSLLEGFEEMICLPLLEGVERYPHQERTALRVMRRLRGRAILGDEVGLGKTIETGLILKEYVCRGLVKRALVLCPPSLVEQWQYEMSAKFDLCFRTSFEEEVRRRGAAMWSHSDLLIAPYTLARRSPHREALAESHFDLLVVDEAHHLRKRNSASWRVVHDIPRKYLLLLTATPVQNDLEELYNLITLLRPGQLGTPAQFRKRFVDPKDPRKPKNSAALRDLMLDTMVRNTRAGVNLVLPPRRARTIRLSPGADEARLLEEVQTFVSQRWSAGGLSRMALTTLLLESGSSPAALTATLDKLGETGLANKARSVGLGAKASALRQLVQSIGAPMLVFSRFRATLEHLRQALEAWGIPAFAYHGAISPSERERQMEAFRSRGGVLLLSEIGGEGKNLQFCRHLVNFDLPWNPMKIEQRVGRLHRIGQTQPIEIVNLCLQGSLEDYLLRILDDKLNMFELVVGELDMVLGPLEEHGDFEDLLVELRARHPSTQALEKEMEVLGDQLIALLKGHQADKAYDAALFGDDFQVES